MEILNLENVEMGPRNGEHICLSCEYDGFSYHVWIDPTRWETKDNLMYKNPPPTVGRNHPDFFHTRYKDVSYKQPGTILKLMVEIAKSRGLYEKFLARERRQEANRERKNREAKRVAAAKEAGPRLLKALKRVAAAFPEVYNLGESYSVTVTGEAIDQVAKLIYKLERSKP